jgi:hypothetical protein
VTPIEWLNLTNTTDTDHTNLELVARLYCKNRGDFRVTSWDDFAGGMPYYDGKYGLTWEEALDLIEMGHFLTGLMAAFDNVHKDEVAVMVSDEILKYQRWSPGLYGGGVDDHDET